jgi:hypothetical protein
MSPDTALPMAFPDWQLADAEPLTRLRQQGFVMLAPVQLAALAGVERESILALHAAWADLPPDPHLRDGGRYRHRRHASLRLDASGMTAEIVDRPHWQPVDYNALHGGIERRFAPVAADWLTSPAFAALLSGLYRLCATAGAGGPAAVPDHVEVHQFRITTADGIGRPTPEGAHRDGVDWVVVLLMDRVGVRGGETRVFAADGPAGIRFTMQEPLSALVLDDHRVIHETTPLQPEPGATDSHRDTLVITFRAGGFLDPPTL